MTANNQGPLCPQCGEPSTGNFCQHCGAKLGGRFCTQCGSELAAGTAFCNQCGAESAGGGAAGGGHRAAAAAGVGGRNLPWWIAGVLLIILIVFVSRSMVRQLGPAAPTGSGAAGPAGTGALPDLSQMTPIEAADRLFNRVMQSVSDQDSTQAQEFLPMTIAAYERARPLDFDGLLHLSMLNRVAMNLEEALDNALEILEQDPNHLLGLSAAAEAALELGAVDDAEAYYRRILEVYDEERERPLVEYDMHSRVVAMVKNDAEAFLAGR
jgi:Double zinc ribbon